MTTTNLKTNDKNNGSKTHKSLNSTSITGVVTGESDHFNKTLQKTLDDGAADMVEQAQRYKNNPAASRAGFVVEADHCATFNARKALERDSTRATRQPNGNHGDIKIVKNGKTLAEAEVKYHGTAEKTETAMRGYDDQQLVAPADHVNDIKKIAARKAAKNNASDKSTRQQVGKEHEAVAENVTDSITDGKTKSTPRTRAEAKKIASDAAKGKTTPVSSLPPLKESVKTAGKSGAKTGAACGAMIGGGISAISNTKAYLGGEIDGAEALLDTTVVLGKSAADGAVKGAVGSVATTAAKHAAAKVSAPLAKSVLKSSAPAAIAIGTIEVGKHAIDLATGEIGGEEFVEKTAKTAATGAGAWGGAQGGAAIGAMIAGPVGGIVGGIAGGFFGAIGIGSLFD